MSLIKKNIKLISKFVFVLIFIFPVKGMGYLSGIPFNSKLFFILFVLILICVYKAKDNYLKICSIFFITIFIFKVIFILNPPNLWSICVDDSSTPIQSRFNYEYIDSPCAKSFNNLNSIFTDKVTVINYETLDPDYEWLGANSSNFPLGFLNHSKFNIYELRRDWLPFKMNLYKELDKNTSQLEINYIGELTVKFNDGTTGFAIPTRYWNENTVVIEVPEGANFVTIKYSYIQWKIKQIPTLKSGYPYERFAKLKIIEKGSPDNNRELYSLFVILGFLILNLKNLFREVDKNYLLLLSLSILFSLIYNFDLSQNRLIKLYAYLSLLLIYLFFNNLKFAHINFLHIFILLSFVIIDYPWNNFDLIVKPGGSDSLTYENQARLMLEGDGLRGGASIFLYSPGYRYFLFLLHTIFGDFWNVVWIAILSLCVNFIYLNADRYNPISFLFILFLISDNVRNIFLYGMSEASALVLFLISIYLINREKIFPGVLLMGIGVLVRPETGLYALLVLFLNYKKLKLRNYASFGGLLALPLIHNLYYGNEFIVLTSGWNYGRNLDFDFAKNLNYLLINPFNEKILMTLGSTIIYIGFSVLVLSILNFLISIYKQQGFLNNKFFLYGILNLLPFVIYDPELFYPRHIIIGLCFLSLNNIYNKEWLIKRIKEIQ
ncbi:MAG: hypothetical protein ACJ0GT_00085 [Candidatus Actinomarina sp.]|tara:strand:- start:13963 stop:15948 length:1986 start_codon:yes stop_codon:yes gene_type:complete